MKNGVTLSRLNSVPNGLHDDEHFIPQSPIDPIVEVVSIHRAVTGTVTVTVPKMYHCQIGLYKNGLMMVIIGAPSRRYERVINKIS